MKSKFKRFYLNQHVATEIESAIPMELWNRCLQDIKLEDLYGMSCWCGLDMSAREDIAGFVQVSYKEDVDKYIVYPHLFTPVKTLLTRSQRDNQRYDIWAEQGHLIALPGGEYINFTKLYEHIKKLSDNFQVEEIGFDRWGAIGIAGKLEEDFTIVQMGQGTKTQAPAIADFENLLLENRLLIKNNPCLTWMASCVVAENAQSGTNIKYNKKKSRCRIDGIIAMLMGISRAVHNNIKPKLSRQPLTEEYLQSLGWK